MSKKQKKHKSQKRPLLVTPVKAKKALQRPTDTSHLQGNIQSTIQVKKKEGVSHWLLSIFKRWRLFLAGMASGVFFNVLSNIITGFIQPFIPIDKVISSINTFIKDNPIKSFLAASALLVGTVTPFVAYPLQKKYSTSHHPSTFVKKVQHWAIAVFLPTASPIVSSLLFLSWISAAWLHPSWCPSLVCPSPQMLVVTNPQGSHDNNIDIYTNSIPDEYYVLRDSPSTYSINHLPNETNDPRVNKTTDPYRMIIGLHNLRRDIDIKIPQVNLVIEKVTPLPNSLNVWYHPPQQDYQGGIYKVTYHGERAKAQLSAMPSPPYASVQLAPGEADTIDLQVSSEIPANLIFQVQVTYYLVNDMHLQKRIMQGTFPVIFMDASNWHFYKLLSGCSLQSNCFTSA